MIWIFIIGGIIVFIIYGTVNDRNKMLAMQVDSQGGMMKKYEKLITYLSQGGTCKIEEPHRGMMNIHISMGSISSVFLITESYGKVTINWIGQLGIFGNHEHSWVFPSNYPLEEIIKEIDKYLIEKDNRLNCNKI